MPVSSTVQQFRQGVIKKGGPQIAAKYRASLTAPFGSILAYPLSIILPGRNFVFYDHDLWGPVRKIPFKRGYTQCNMSFVIYQDWYERKFLEQWMNFMIIPSTAKSGGTNFKEVNTIFNNEDSQTGLVGLLGTIGQSTLDFFSSLTEGAPPTALFGIAESQSNDASSKNSYAEYVNYSNVRNSGRITIECLNSKSGKPNTTFSLYEAYPAQITPVALGSDGTGYPSFTVSFQFNYYTVT